MTPPFTVKTLGRIAASKRIAVRSCMLPIYLEPGFLFPLKQGCRFGKPWIQQYLDPAWYHLWRIVSESVCAMSNLVTHRIHGTGIFTYIYHKKINQM